MRDLLAKYAVIIITVTSLALFSGYRVFTHYKVKQLENDRLVVVNGLVDFNNKYGAYPLKGKIKEFKGPNPALVELKRRVSKGVIKNKNIVDDIYLIDLNSLKTSVKLSTTESYFMIKDNPYSAFCSKDLKNPDFQLENTNKKYVFNIMRENKAISVGGKTMSKINCSKVVRDNLCLVGGEGQIYLAKVIDSRYYPISLADDVTAVTSITDRYIVAKKKDGSTVSYRTMEVTN